MHEVGLAQETLDLAMAAANRGQAQVITVLRVAVGELSGVEVEALRFALETLAKDTPAAGARIEIEKVPARAYCETCAAAFAATVHAYACPRCGRVCPQVTQGKDLRLVSLEVQ